MKRTKIISIILSLVLCLSFVSVFGSAADTNENAKLKFNSDGKFTILQFSDFQEARFSTLSKHFVKDSIKQVKPDLVVLTGDNIAGYSCGNEKKSKKGIDGFMKIFEQNNIPVALVFGNHDDDRNTMSKESQMDYYTSTYKCCIAQKGFMGSHGDVGTYNVPIYSSDGQKIAFNLWMMDSGSYDENGSHDRVHSDQLLWYMKKSNELKVQTGHGVPSICFQHIVVGEIWDALKEVDEKTAGAISRDVERKENGESVWDKKFYTLPAGALGELNEKPCPGAQNDGQFAAMKIQGDVLAIVTGHDHTNTFDIDYKGIRLINTAAAGLDWNDGMSKRGARVFTLNENNPTQFDTYTTLISKTVSDDIIANLLYTVVDIYYNIATFFRTLFNK